MVGIAQRAPLVRACVYRCLGCGPGVRRRTGWERRAAQISRHAMAAEAQAHLQAQLVLQQMQLFARSIGQMSGSTTVTTANTLSGAASIPGPRVADVPDLMAQAATIPLPLPPLSPYMLHGSEGLAAITEASGMTGSLPPTPSAPLSGLTFNAMS
jgi:hypothetical protein